MKATISLFLAFLSLYGCSSAQPIRTQAYAELNPERTFEYDFPLVWKGIEETLRNFKVVDRNPKNVDPLEMRNLTHRTLETDWIYGQSRDKYHEFQVNGSPRKIYLQTRFKYLLDAKSVLGGVHVKSQTIEEIERLNSNGTPAGYSQAESPDSSRSHELLEKIRLSILSGAP